MLPNFITRIVQLFNQRHGISKMGFLSSFFKTSSDSFTDAENFEYDITRSGEDVAPVVRNLSTGAVLIAEDEFQSKSIPFPVHALAKPANIAKLMKRQPGENAYAEKVNWFGKLAKILVDGFAKMTAMIRYSVELQAAQVLQTGKIILTDEKEIYKLISIGSKEEIFKRLKVKLDQDFQKGKIDKACFAQANETKLNSIMPKDGIL